MTLSVTIPTLQTDRLTIRAPQVADFDAFCAFMASDRTTFIGGPFDTKDTNRIWGNLAGMWVLRGFGNFIVTLKDGTPLGSVGPWHPMDWPEPEFSWSLWSADYEGKGYVTEAMTAILPWAWDTIGADRIVSYVDVANHASAGVAKRLGATLDQPASDLLNDPTHPLYTTGQNVRVYRHHKGALA